MIERYMIWLWVGIFIILYALRVFTKSKLLYPFLVANLIVIILSIGFEIIYYYEILSFVALSIGFLGLYYLYLKKYCKKIDN